MIGACSTRVGGRKLIRILVNTHEGKRPLGVPRRRWEINIAINIHKIVCDNVYSIQLALKRNKW
jgi:hypothetical protein